MSVVCALRKELPGEALGAHLLQPRVWPWRRPGSACGDPEDGGDRHDPLSPGIYGFSPFACLSPFPDGFVVPLEVSLTS